MNQQRCSQQPRNWVSPNASSWLQWGAALQQHDPGPPFEASYKRIPFCIFLAEFVVTCPVIFAFCVHFEVPPGIPSNETLRHWGSEAIKSECFCQTLGANTVSSHLPEMDSQVDTAKFGKNNSPFLSGLMQFFKKLSCAVIFLPRHRWRFYILHRANVEGLPGKVVRAWSFSLQNNFEGREILSSLLNSAKVSDLCVFLSSSNNPAFLQSCGDGPITVYILFSWCKTLCKC